MQKAWIFTAVLLVIFIGMTAYWFCSKQPWIDRSAPEIVFTVCHNPYPNVYNPGIKDFKRLLKKYSTKNYTIHACDISGDRCWKVTKCTLTIDTGNKNNSGVSKRYWHMPVENAFVFDNSVLVYRDVSSGNVEEFPYSTMDLQTGATKPYAQDWPSMIFSSAFKPSKLVGQTLNSTMKSSTLFLEWDDAENLWQSTTPKAFEALENAPDPFLYDSYQWGDYLCLIYLTDVNTAKTEPVRMTVADVVKDEIIGDYLIDCSVTESPTSVKLNKVSPYVYQRLMNSASMNTHRVYWCRMLIPPIYDDTAVFQICVQAKEYASGKYRDYNFPANTIGFYRFDVRTGHAKPISEFCSGEMLNPVPDTLANIKYRNAVDIGRKIVYLWDSLYIEERVVSNKLTCGAKLYAFYGSDKWEAIDENCTCMPKVAPDGGLWFSVKRSEIGETELIRYNPDTGEKKTVFTTEGAVSNVMTTLE